MSLLSISNTVPILRPASPSGDVGTVIRLELAIEREVEKQLGISPA